MQSYMYPTKPNWFNDVLEEWKSSNHLYLAFPFLWFSPTTLPKDKDSYFWLYLYYTEKRTEELALQRAVQYRARVIQWSENKSDFSGCYVHEDADAKVWFKCDVVEELRAVNGGFLKDGDFRHSRGVNLLSALRTSIAPVERVSIAITVQKTGFFLND